MFTRCFNKVMSSAGCTFCYLNPYVTNGLSHPYQFELVHFHFQGIGSIFSYLFHFPMKTTEANRIAPDRTAASHLGLFCLNMSHKKDASLIPA